MRKLKTLPILSYHKPTGNSHIFRIFEKTAVADVRFLYTHKYKGTDFKICKDYEVFSFVTEFRSILSLHQHADRKKVTK